MLREEEEEEEEEEGGREYTEQRGGGERNKVGGPHVGRAVCVKTIDFKRLYVNYTVQQNKNSYEEQLLQ